MKNILFLIALLIFNIVLSQNDSKAENLLNKVSEKIDNAKSYQIDFTYTLENTLDGINQDLKGTIIIENDNYLLNFMGINQICDSEYIYTKPFPSIIFLIISYILTEYSEIILKSKKGFSFSVFILVNT